MKRTSTKRHESHKKKKKKKKGGYYKKKRKKKNKKKKNRQSEQFNAHGRESFLWSWGREKKSKNLASETGPLPNKRWQ